MKSSILYATRQPSNRYFLLVKYAQQQHVVGVSITKQQLLDARAYAAKSNLQGQSLALALKKHLFG